MDLPGKRVDPILAWMIKTTFSLTLKGYLIPQTSNQQVLGHIFEMGKQLSPSKVVFGFEGDATSRQVSTTISVTGENLGGTPAQGGDPEPEPPSPK